MDHRSGCPVAVVMSAVYHSMGSSGSNIPRVRAKPDCQTAKTCPHYARPQAAVWPSGSTVHRRRAMTEAGATDGPFVAIRRLSEPQWLHSSATASILRPSSGCRWTSLSGAQIRHEVPLAPSPTKAASAEIVPGLFISSCVVYQNLRCFSCAEHVCTRRYRIKINTTS